MKWRVEYKNFSGQWKVYGTATHLFIAEAGVRQIKPMGYKLRIVYHTIPTEAVYE